MTKRFATGMLMLFVFLVGADATACTTVCFTDAAGPVVAYNYDFYSGDGLVLVNPRGLTKASVVRGHPHTWTARFVSLTFNQFGRDLPMTGINESGLFVSQMWLDEGKYPAVDARPEVNPLEWVQLQLDTAASVADVLKTVREVRIRSGPPLHFLVADRAGNAAVIEFLDGELRARTGAELPIPALTNSTYAASLASLARHKGFGGDGALPHVSPTGDTSLARFVVAAADRAAPTGGDPIAQAFGTLERVRQSGSTPTRWSIVYELGSQRAHFRTEGQAAIRRVDLTAFDLGCTQPARMLDIDAPLDGDVTAHLTAYTTAANLDLVMRSFRKTPFLANTRTRESEVSRAIPSARGALLGTLAVTDGERLTRGR